jgi:hypothetical protein
MPRRRFEALLGDFRISCGPEIPDVTLDDLVAARKTVVTDQVLVDAGCPECGLPLEPPLDDLLEGIKFGGRLLLAAVRRLCAFLKVALDGAPVPADHPTDLCVGVTLAVQGVDVHELLLVDHRVLRLLSFKVL